jgi:glycosyltransferase involved in cell wall biosynthesis
MIKLAYLVSHPIQYQAPLLRLISGDPEIDLTVFFCSNISVGEFIDPEFKQAISWDIPLVDGYKHEFLPAFGRSDVLGFVQPVVYGLKDRLLAGKYDALWVHGWGHWSHIGAIKTAYRLGIPVLLRGEANLHLESGSILKKILKAGFMRWLTSRASQFLSIGSWNRQFYLHYGVAEERIHSVPYAVDNGFFQSIAREASRTREQLRESLGLKAGKPVILYASKLTARKRVIDLLDAYIKLSPDGRSEPDACLLVVGDGELRAELLSRINALGWNSIKILGFKNQTELPRYFDLCDVFVLPSLKEPWGLIINEVMNAARPVIASDQVGAAPDLVKDGVNGFVFKAGDVDDLHRALKSILAHPGQAKLMGTKSLEIINRWSFKQDISGIKSALATVMAAA